MRSRSERRSLLALSNRLLPLRELQPLRLGPVVDTAWSRLRQNRLWLRLHYSQTLVHLAIGLVVHLGTSLP